jgi:hypothetical protein
VDDDIHAASDCRHNEPAADVLPLLLAYLADHDALRGI